MPKVRVRPGDCISSIAYRYGFFPDVIWSHPENASLRDVRPDPNALLPGDMVFVPVKDPKREDCATEQRHRFRRRGVPERLRVVLRVAGEPRANVDFVAEVGDVATTGTTDGDGRVSLYVRPDAERARITLADTGEVIELALGHMDPVDTLRGAQARLVTQGYAKAVTGEWDGRSARALERFQREHGLEPTSELDEASSRKLEELHGR